MRDAPLIGYISSAPAAAAPVGHAQLGRAHGWYEEVLPIEEAGRSAPHQRAMLFSCPRTSAEEALLIRGRRSFGTYGCCIIWPRSSTRTTPHHNSIKKICVGVPLEGGRRPVHDFMVLMDRGRDTCLHKLESMAWRELMTELTCRGVVQIFAAWWWFRNQNCRDFNLDHDGSETGRSWTGPRSCTKAWSLTRRPKSIPVTLTHPRCTMVLSIFSKNYFKIARRRIVIPEAIMNEAIVRDKC
jgi:hypothetical protein